MTEAGFKQIDDDEQAFGPKVVLASGFSTDEVPELTGMLAALDAPDHRVVLCSEKLLHLTLVQAMGAADPGTPVAADQLPRALVLSGLTGAQVQGLFAAWRASGMPRPIFAQTTTSNLDWTVTDLLLELLREQKEMARERQGQ